MAKNRAVLTHRLGFDICQTAVSSRRKNCSLEIVLGQSARLGAGEEVTMQVLTKRYPKNCLLTVIDRYSEAVHNMEQVVMLPSLLQDAQLSAQGRWAGGPDLYNCFTMLKAICVDVDHGLLPREEWQVKMAGGEANEAENEDTQDTDGEVLRQLDLEAQFHLHFSRLHHILTHLTLKAQEVTKIYQEITGQAI